MTFILVILTVAIILVVELVKGSKKKQLRVVPKIIADHPTTFEVFDRYFHTGHMWAMVSSSRKVTVGIDDFSAQMIGDVGKADLPQSGQTIHQGEPFAVLHHGIRTLTQVAPISGRISEVNRKVQHNPGVLNGSPLDLGWIAKIVPTNLEADLRNLLKGVAAEGWRESVRNRLIQLAAPKVGTLMQDGGQIVRNLGDHFSDDEWTHIVEEFFPRVQVSQPQKKQ